MLSPNWKSLWAILIATATFTLPAHSQGTSVLAQLSRPSGVFEGEINSYDVNPVGVTEHSISDPWGSAYTLAQAKYGILKAKAVASATDEAFGRFSARAGATFSDILTVTTPGLEGQAGILHANIIFDRKLSLQGNAVDSYATASLSGGTNLSSFSYMETLWLQPGSCNPLTSSTCSLALTSVTNDTETMRVQWLTNDRLSVSVPIMFGQSTPFYLSLDTSALASYYVGPSSWSADASHSIYWGGIASVTNAIGVPVEYSVESASTTDYRASFATPVPEPGTYGMFLAGLMLMASVVKRSRRLVGILDHMT